MFEVSLETKLKNIFRVPKVTFDFPSTDQEQDCLFINVTEATSRVSHGLYIAQVSGQISMFTRNDKVPFGYFNRKINAASSVNTKDFYFYNLDQNRRYLGNLVERTCSFVYHYRAEYEHEAGEIDEIVLDPTDEGDEAYQEHIEED